jgi:hypothetical protein
MLPPSAPNTHTHTHSDQKAEGDPRIRTLQLQRHRPLTSRIPLWQSIHTQNPTGSVTMEEAKEMQGLALSQRERERERERENLADIAPWTGQITPHIHTYRHPRQICSLQRHNRGMPCYQWMNMGMYCITMHACNAWACRYGITMHACNAWACRYCITMHACMGMYALRYGFALTRPCTKDQLGTTS